MENIAIIGAGAWGTALAMVARRAGRNVVLQAHEPEVVDAVNEACENSLFLPGVALDPEIRATNDPAEAAADADGRVQPFSGETDIFITPGYRFRIADGLLTNFHLPCSTLFMLVAAFSGLQTMKAVYEHAKSAGYRFYSYGDACFLERSNQEAERTGGPTGKQQEVSKG